MRVTICGPNLPGNTETFHVHAEGCADLKRSRTYRGAPMWQMDAISTDHITTTIYDPSDFDYDENDPAEVAFYKEDIRLFPCVTLA